MGVKAFADCRRSLRYVARPELGDAERICAHRNYLIVFEPVERAHSYCECSMALQVTERILREQETDEDLQLIVAPGSSLGGAPPKASVIDLDAHLSIASFQRRPTNTASSCGRP